jgi:hypothetical protein
MLLLPRYANKKEHAEMSNEPLKKEEDQPNKAFSFIVGIFIAMGIIILFAIFLSH